MRTLESQIPGSLGEDRNSADDSWNGRALFWASSVLGEIYVLVKERCTFEKSRSLRGAWQEKSPHCEYISGRGLCFKWPPFQSQTKHCKRSNDALIVLGNLDALRSDSTCVFSCSWKESIIYQTALETALFCVSTGCRYSSGSQLSVKESVSECGRKEKHFLGFFWNPEVFFGSEWRLLYVVILVGAGAF